MRKLIMYAASTGGALADDHAAAQGTSRAGAMAADQFERQIDALGYDLRSLETDDGVFETRIVDRESRLS